MLLLAAVTRQGRCGTGLSREARWLWKRPVLWEFNSYLPDVQHRVNGLVVVSTRDRL